MYINLYSLQSILAALFYNNPSLVSQASGGIAGVLCKCKDSSKQTVNVK